MIKSSHISKPSFFFGVGYSAKLSNAKANFGQ